MHQPTIDSSIIMRERLDELCQEIRRAMAPALVHAASLYDEAGGLLWMTSSVLNDDVALKAAFERFKAAPSTALWVAHLGYDRSHPSDPRSAVVFRVGDARGRPVGAAMAVLSNSALPHEPATAASLLTEPVRRVLNNFARLRSGADGEENAPAVRIPNNAKVDVMPVTPRPAHPGVPAALTPTPVPTPTPATGRPAPAPAKALTPTPTPATVSPAPAPARTPTPTPTPATVRPAPAPPKAPTPTPAAVRPAPALANSPAPKPAPVKTSEASPAPMPSAAKIAPTAASSTSATSNVAPPIKSAPIAIPTTAKIPATGKIPEAAKVPTIARVPAAATVPTTAKVPAATKVPTPAKVPAAATVPTTVKIPASAKIAAMVPIAESAPLLPIAHSVPRVPNAESAAAVTITRKPAVAAALRDAPPVPQVKSAPVAQRPPAEATAGSNPIHEAVMHSPLKLYVQRFVPLDKGSRQKRYELLWEFSGAASLRALAELKKNRPDDKTTSVIDRRVFAELLAWLKQHPQVGQDKNTTLTIKLSRSALYDRDFVPFVARTLQKSGVPKGMIGFEIPAVTPRKSVAAITKLALLLRQTGCFLALDNFSLRTEAFNALHLPGVQLIKLSHEVTAKMPRDKLARAGISAMTQMARVLGIQAVAKRTKLTADLVRLTSFGVDFVQSESISPAQPIASLATRRSPSAISSGSVTPAPAA